jgi:hypothetical protein
VWIIAATTAGAAPHLETCPARSDTEETHERFVDADPVGELALVGASALQGEELVLVPVRDVVVGRWCRVRIHASSPLALNASN